MKKRIKIIASKGIKIVLIFCVSIVLILFLVPIVFRETITEKIKTLANQNLEGQVDFSRARFSFFDYFPALTLTVSDLSLKGSAPYKNKTLLVAKKIGLIINLKRFFFNDEIKVNRVFISDALIDIKVNEKGETNYNIYVSDKPADTNRTTARIIILEKIDIRNVHFKYNDTSKKIAVEAKGFTYIGGANVISNNIDLHAKTQIDTLNFYYDGIYYLKNKQVKASLITSINPHTITFLSKDNYLKVNNFPIIFTGKFKILKDGYDINFSANSENSRLEDIYGAIPVKYATWFERTKLGGKTSFTFSLKGIYDTLKNIKPDLVFDIIVRNGFVQKRNAPLGISNLYLDLKTRMPSMNVDSLNIKMDSLFFNLGEKSLSAVVEKRGIDNSVNKLKVKANLDLEALDKAFEIPNVEMKGLLDTDINLSGAYDVKKREFPITDVKINLKNGWIKTDYYPNPITDINVKANVINTSGKYQDLQVNIIPISFLFEDKPFHLTVALNNLDDLYYDINAVGEVDIAKIYKVFSKKSLGFSGHIKADLSLKGKQSDVLNKKYNELNNKGNLVLSNIDLATLDKIFEIPHVKMKGILNAAINTAGVYDPKKKILPITDVKINLKNGWIKTDYYPNPITAINIDVNTVNTSGMYKDLKMNITSASFIFENTPFYLTASLNNLDDLDYDIKVKGEADVAKMYKVFSKKELNSKGYVKADIALKGKRSYIKNKEFNKLNNKGALILNNINLAVLNGLLPIPNVEVKGILNAAINIDGIYDVERKILPTIDAKINLENGWVKTSYYPNPITAINIDANVVNTSGMYKDLKVNIPSTSFLFEDNPFYLKAVLNDLDDINYDVYTKGEIDIAKIYKVFSKEGFELNGYIKADLSVQGKQSYAVNKEYNKLNNKGTLALTNIQKKSKYFPKPFFLKEGVFFFDKDKMWLKKFNAVYGQSDFSLDGYLQNIVDFIFSEEGILKGEFNMKSNFIDVNEFMALKSDSSVSIENEEQTVEIKKAKQDNLGATGVVLVPSNLDLQLNVAADKIDYEGLNIQNFKGCLEINQGKMLLNNMNFNLIDCNVIMDAAYKDYGPTKADFDFHFRAQDFDVKKAYNEIELFRKMVTIAEKAEGVVSVDYKMKGILDANMIPVYSSLEGGGILSVGRVKFNGAKLFRVISEKTGSAGVDNPDISKVSIQTTVKNNVIDVERFKMGVSVFRMRVEGKTNFNGQLGLKIRLGLPPLGIIGIPITVEGTSQNPEIKIFSKKTDGFEGIP